MNTTQKHVLAALEYSAGKLETYEIGGVVYLQMKHGNGKAILEDGEIVDPIEAIKRNARAQIEADHAEAARALAVDVASGVYRNQDAEDQARAKANAAKKSELEKGGWTAEIFSFEAPKAIILSASRAVCMQNRSNLPKICLKINLTLL